MNVMNNFLFLFGWIHDSYDLQYDISQWTNIYVDYNF